MPNSNVNDFCLHFLILSRAEYGTGSCFLLQGFFPTQGSNPVLLHCRWILYQLSHQRSLYFPIHAAKPGYWPITFTKLFIDFFFFFFLSTYPETQTQIFLSISLINHFDSYWAGSETHKKSH